MSDRIVVFYSRADENYVSGAIKSLETGNTEIAAKYVSESSGAELFKIEQEKPYSANYNECIAEAQSDQRSNARPKLKKLPKSMERYDVIYLGYPNYWGTMPMAVFTFLESFDFSGKKIRPFCTHEGSGLGNSISDIKRLFPKAIVEKGLSVRGGSVEQVEEDIKKWALEE